MNLASIRLVGITPAAYAAPSFAERLQERAWRAAEYERLRRAHPELSARVIFLWLTEGSEGCLTFEQFICERTTGHSWNHTPGEADEAFLSGDYENDNVRCSYCGADGDA